MNNRDCLYGKQYKTNQGYGFKVGETVTVIIDIKKGTIEWKINN